MSRPVVLVRLAVKVALYRAQPPFFTAMRRAVARLPPESWRVTVSVVPAPARAHTEKSYLAGPCAVGSMFEISNIGQHFERTVRGGV
ncbi:hypothetical protein [Streptomyces sp. NPDC002550]